MITKAQARVLQAIAHNGWWPNESQARTRGLLRDRGLIEHTKGSLMSDGLYAVTAKGYIALDLFNHKGASK